MCPNVNHLILAKSVAHIYLPFTEPLDIHVLCKTW